MSPDLASLAARARDLVPADGSRAILGIAGAPGAGKTTLALDLVAALRADPPAGAGADWVVHVPMDGFHLADVALRRLDRLERKGAPDTFDAAGYTALLRRLRSDTAGVVYAPAFDREIEQPVAGSIAVPPDCRLVLTEGNYLLLDAPEWRAARAASDEVWFCRVDDGLRESRLLDRHVRFGKAPDEARAWMRAVDEPNARLIAASAGGADLTVQLGSDW